MGRLTHATFIVALLLVALFAFPTAVACPEPPKSCGSWITDNIQLSSSTSVAGGLYVDDEDISAAATNDEEILPVLSAQHDSSAMSSHPEFHPGDHGGVVMRITTVDPDASSVTFVFDGSPKGITWDGASTFTFSGADLKNDSYAVLPFTIGGNADDLGTISIGVLVKDDLGNEKVSTFTANILPVSPQGTPSIGLVPLTLALAAMAVWARRRN